MATGRQRDFLSRPAPHADGRRRERTESSIRISERYAASSRRASGTGSYQGYGTGSVYDVAPDGQRFLINLVTGTELPAQTPVTIVTNWTSLLRSGQTPRCAEEDVLAVILRMLAPVTVILFTCSAVAALQEQRGTDPSLDLDRFVNGERLAQQLPGLAAVIVRSDGPPRVYVSGERRIGKGDLITPADRMHLGSLTKAITATLIGALAEKQLMTLETTIGQTFPELSAKIQPAYRDVSVRQLLAHAAGIPPYRTTQSLRWLLTLKGTPSEQRYAFVERVLTEPPRFEPGTRHEYLECWCGDCRRDGRADRRFAVSATRPAAGFRSAWRPRGVWQSWTRGRASAVGTHSNDSRYGHGGHTRQRGLYDSSRDRTGRRRIAIDAGLRALSATPLAWSERPR